jgi:hypothetical protein
MGSLYTFWEVRLLSTNQHLIGKKPGVESACLLIYMVVLQIQMSKWHESAHGLVRKLGHQTGNPYKSFPSHMTCLQM